ncbi:MAG: PEP-CTERM sorting domain-containing protein [Planctomycetes bacterium]|nr:PEP-CTERM sorting domain-containing protein [Planctomycetota bacterium]
MFRKSFLSIFLGSLFAASAHAADVTGGVNFGGPTQDFSLDLSVTPGSTITVSGSGVYHLVHNFLFNVDQDINIPLQTRPISLNPDTITFSSDPVGSATVGFDNVSLANGTLSDTIIDFRNGATWNFQFDPIIFDVDIEDVADGVELRLDISGSITAFSFEQDPGTEPVASNGIYSLPGFFVAGYNTSITAELTDVLGVDFDLGEISSTSNTSNIAENLPGAMTLTDLGGPVPSDLGVDLDLDLSGLPPALLTFPLDTSGQVSQVEGHSTGNLDLTVDYVVDADLVLSNLLYALNGSLAGVVVPEPGSFVLMSVGMFGASTWRRRRRK